MNVLSGEDPANTPGVIFAEPIALLARLSVENNPVENVRLAVRETLCLPVNFRFDSFVSPSTPTNDVSFHLPVCLMRLTRSSDRFVPNDIFLFEACFISCLIDVQDEAVQAMTATVNRINASWNNRDGRPAPKLQGADDVLPLFIFLTIQVCFACLLFTLGRPSVCGLQHVQFARSQGLAYSSVLCRRAWPAGSIVESHVNRYSCCFAGCPSKPADDIHADGDVCWS